MCKFGLFRSRLSTFERHYSAVCGSYVQEIIVSLYLLDVLILGEFCLLRRVNKLSYRCRVISFLQYRKEVIRRHEMEVIRSLLTPSQ